MVACVRVVCDVRVAPTLDGVVPVRLPFIGNGNEANFIEHHRIRQGHVGDELGGEQSLIVDVWFVLALRTFVA